MRLWKYIYRFNNTKFWQYKTHTDTLNLTIINYTHTLVQRLNKKEHTYKLGSMTCWTIENTLIQCEKCSNNNNDNYEKKKHRERWRASKDFWVFLNLDFLCFRHFSKEKVIVTPQRCPTPYLNKIVVYYKLFFFCECVTAYGVYTVFNFCMFK